MYNFLLVILNSANIFGSITFYMGKDLKKSNCTKKNLLILFY